MKIILFVFCCGFTLTVSAQMLDLLGSRAVDGVMMRGSASSVSGAMRAFRNTQMIQALSQTVNLIRIDLKGDYRSIHAHKVVGDPLDGYEYTLSSDRPHEFNLTLENIDKDTCRNFVSSGVGALRIDVNEEGDDEDACTASSKIKFTFE